MHPRAPELAALQWRVIAHLTELAPDQPIGPSRNSPPAHQFRTPGGRRIYRLQPFLACRDHERRVRHLGIDQGSHAVAETTAQPRRASIASSRRAGDLAVGSNPAPSCGEAPANLIYAFQPGQAWSGGAPVGLAAFVISPGRRQRNVSRRLEGRQRRTATDRRTVVKSKRREQAERHGHSVSRARRSTSRGGMRCAVPPYAC